MSTGKKVALIIGTLIVLGMIMQAIENRDGHTKSDQKTNIDKHNYETPKVSTPKEKLEKMFRVLSVDSKCTEANNVWHKYAWKLTLENLSTQGVSLIATLQWLDADGFVIDEDIDYNIHLMGSETKTFRGYQLISMPAASNVQTINASVKKRGS